MEKGAETINSIERALNILELLSKEECEMGVVEIAKSLGVYQSTVHRTLATLMQKGYIYQNTENSRYGLGIKLYSIGMVAGHAFSWLDVAKPYLMQLAAEFDETVNLSVMDFGEREKLNCVLLYQKSLTKRVLGSSQIIGESTPCYCSGVGKSLLAYADENLTNRIRRTSFVKYTKNTIDSPEKLMENLELVRERGYALDEEEQEDGLYCVSCPVLNRKGFALAAVSVSGLRSRIEAAGVERIAKSLRRTASEISSLLD